MLRTRDLVLVLTVVGFLLVSVGATVFWQTVDHVKAGPEVHFVEPELGEIRVDSYEPETISREERLSSMRQKIEQGLDMDIVLTSTEETEGLEEREELLFETELDEETGKDLEEVSSVGPQFCDDYVEFSGVWSPQEIFFDVVGGTHLVYRERVSEYVASSIATSGQQLSPEIPEDIIMTLSGVIVASQYKTCLSSDVVGIALDGSLIKNSEAGLYGIFDSETLVGYALDSYPIYGSSVEQTDECGFGFADGKFGYYLSSDRNTVLNCFVRKPIDTSFLY